MGRSFRADQAVLNATLPRLLRRPPRKTLWQISFPTGRKSRTSKMQMRHFASASPATVLLGRRLLKNGLRRQRGDPLLAVRKHLLVVLGSVVAVLVPVAAAGAEAEAGVPSKPPEAAGVPRNLPEATEVTGPAEL